MPKQNDDHILRKSCYLIGQLNNTYRNVFTMGEIEIPELHKQLSNESLSSSFLFSYHHLSTEQIPVELMHFNL